MAKTVYIQQNAKFLQPFRLSRFVVKNISLFASNWIPHEPILAACFNINCRIRDTDESTFLLSASRVRVKVELPVSDLGPFL
jgi:hypothetical protein